LPSSSRSKSKRINQDAGLCLLLFIWLNFRHLKIEEERASDTSVNFSQMTQYRILYDSFLSITTLRTAKPNVRVFRQRKSHNENGGGTVGFDRGRAEGLSIDPSLVGCLRNVFLLFSLYEKNKKSDRNHEQTLRVLR
jgi:hypothetical protein